MVAEQEKPDAKERIMRAAIRLFAAKGYSGTGLRELAREADVNLDGAVASRELINEWCADARL